MPMVVKLLVVHEHLPLPTKFEMQPYRAPDVALSRPETDAKAVGAGTFAVLVQTLVINCSEYF